MTERIRRRARHDIIIGILKAAKDGEKKTRIMQKAQLSFHQLEEYLNALNDAGFITERSRVWKTTPTSTPIAATTADTAETNDISNILSPKREE